MGGLPTPPLLPQSCLHACVRRLAPPPDAQPTAMGGSRRAGAADASI